MDKLKYSCTLIGQSAKCLFALQLAPRVSSLLSWLAGMGKIFDKYSKILQLNRNLRKKECSDATYIAQHAADSILERWGVREAATLHAHPFV